MGRDEQSVTDFYSVKRHFRLIKYKNTVRCRGIFVFIVMNALHLNKQVKNNK
jgi:hypothetical protein